MCGQSAILTQSPFRSFEKIRLVHVRQLYEAPTVYQTLRHTLVLSMKCVH